MRKKKRYPKTDDMLYIDRAKLRIVSNKVHASISYLSGEMYDGRTNLICQRVSRDKPFTREDCEKLAGYLHCDVSDFAYKKATKVVELLADDGSMPLTVPSDTCAFVTKEDFEKTFFELFDALEMRLFGTTGKEDK